MKVGGGEQKRKPGQVEERAYPYDKTKWERENVESKIGLEHPQQEQQRFSQINMNAKCG